MSEQVFRILGIPKPQGRARSFIPKRGDGSMVRLPNGQPMVVHTDDPKSREFKQNVSAQIAAQHPVYIAAGMLFVEVDCYLPRPKTLPKRFTRPEKKPDCSNLVKGIEDAMSGIVWRDDGQIVELIVRKWFGVPSVTVRVKSGMGELV